MQTSALAMKTATALGCAILLTGCLGRTDETPVLDALRDPIVALAVEVHRVDDPGVTGAFRDVAATWEAGIGR